METFKYDGNGNVTEVDTTGNLVGATGTSQTAVKKFQNYTPQNLPGVIVEPNNNYEVLTYGAGAAGSGTIPSVFQVSSTKSYAANGTQVSEIDNTYTTAGTLVAPGTTGAAFASGVLSNVEQGHAQL